MSTATTTAATTGNTTTTTSTATTGNTTTTTITSITTTATTRTTTTTTTTTTTEILSNSSSSGRLLDCLNSLSFQDQRVFRSQLGHTELLRLSACCRSLRSSIRNDTVLWQALYRRDFLSGAYYDKEMEFVLWCIRTDVNNPCTSDKRADLLENVDWYNTYRRRVSTENNWRYGRCKTTDVDMKSDNGGICYYKYSSDNCIIIAQQDCSDEESWRSCILEYLPHSNLRSSNNIVNSITFSTSPNVLSLDIGNTAQHKYVTGDHYIAVSPYPIMSNTSYNVKILTRKRGGLFTTFNIPARYEVETIEGKWILLVYGSQKSYAFSPIFNVMVFDIEDSIMCSGSIDGTWNAARFYKTTNDTAIVYTARLVKDDDTDRIEWALYQFSSNNPVVQLQNGWFQLPEGIRARSISAHNAYDSHMIIELRCNHAYDLYIIHSVASSGQSHTPRNCYTITDQHIPTPLLRVGCDYLMPESSSTKVWTDLTYNDDQVLQIPDTVFIKHIIGDLYVFITSDHYDVEDVLLVNINTKEIVRELDAPNREEEADYYAMIGMIGSLDDRHALIIDEYGEL